MIMYTDAIDYPGTMVVHFQNTSSADAAVVGSRSVCKRRKYEEGTHGLNTLHTLHQRRPALSVDAVEGSYQ